MLRLEPVSGRNIWDLLALKVREDQASFVASNEISILEAYCAIAGGGFAFPFGIYDGSVPVGFLMIGFGTDADWKNPPSIAENNYSLWRLMIDARYQHRGYGRAALSLALDFIRTQPCGPAEACWVSYEPENLPAKALYHSFGFQETGELDGEEIIAVLSL